MHARVVREHIQHNDPSRKLGKKWCNLVYILIKICFKINNFLYKKIIIIATRLLWGT